MENFGKTKIAAAIYTINKFAKKYREAKSDLYDFFKCGGILEKSTVELLQKNTEVELRFVDGELSFDSNWCKEYSDIRTIDKEIRQAEMDIEDAEDDEDVEYEENILAELQEIKEKFESAYSWINSRPSSAMSFLSKEQNKIYELKNSVLEKLKAANQLQLIAYHRFDGGDIRTCYEFADFMFHGSELEAEELETIADDAIVNLPKISEIDNYQFMTAEEAVEFLTNFIKN